MFEVADIGLYEMDDEGEMNVVTRTVHCLSLCSGIGGLELGLSLVVPGFRVVCHVEREASAAALLVARMADKSLDDAPIWDDLTTFDGAAWCGTVDILTAGFPCQPWSVAGKQQGTEDERWIWSDIIRIIREVRPRLIFLENVPGLLVHEGLGGVLGGLAEAGFDAEWGCFTAAEVGASHKRERVFVLAKSSEIRAWDFSGEAGRGDGTQDVRQGDGTTGAGGINSASGELAHANNRGREKFGWPEIHRSLRNCGYENLRPEAEKSSLETRILADAGRFSRDGLQPEQLAGSSTTTPASSEGETLADANAQGSQGRDEQRHCGAECATRPSSATSKYIFPPYPNDVEGWTRVLTEMPSLEPAVCRMADELPNRVDRLRALGNAVVPLEAAYAFATLAARDVRIWNG